MSSSDSSDSEVEEVKVFKFGEQCLSDVIFIVEGKEFHCHRMALAARSPYFASMFTSNFKEKTEERIEIKADAFAFRSLMQILYKGIFDDHKWFFSRFVLISHFWKESCALLELADRFLILDIVRNAFEAYMIISNKRCAKSSCNTCATKLLLALRFKMNDYVAICKADRNTIVSTIDTLKEFQEDLTLSMDAIKILMNRS